VPSYGSLGSPDFTRQLNSAGLSDTQHFTSSSHLSQGLSPLQLPQLPQGGVPWSQEPKWSQEVPWGPLSPRYPTLPPLQNGSSLQLEQLLQDSTELQSPGNAWLGLSQQDLAPVPAPVTPQQRQQTQQLQQDTPPQQPALLAVVLPQEQAGAGAGADLPKPRQVHVPPGVWLVGPEAKHIPPVVQQSDSAAAAGAAAAGMHTKTGLPVQQQQQKRQFRQQAGDPVSRKAGRVHYSTTPASGSTAAAGAGSNAAPASTTGPLTTQPGSMHTASTAAAPKRELGADAVLPGAALTGRTTPALLGLGSLVWGKVNRWVTLCSTALLSTYVVSSWHNSMVCICSADPVSAWSGGCSSYQRGCQATQPAAGCAHWQLSKLRAAPNSPHYLIQPGLHPIRDCRTLLGSTS